MRHLFCASLVTLSACGETPAASPRPDATTRDTSAEASLDAPVDTQVATDVSVDVARDVRLDTSTDSSSASDTSTLNDTATASDTAIDSNRFESRCFARVHASCSPPPCAANLTAEIVNACYSGNCIDPTAVCACTQDSHCVLVDLICRSGRCVPCGNPEPCAG